MTEAASLVGRERELASVGRVLDANGPRVCFVYGLPGVGKSALLEGFAASCRASSTAVWRVDCAAIDPTDAGFRAALDGAGWEPATPGVVIVDTYEMFRIADPWLRQQMVPSLGSEVRFVIAGRDAPMLEWSTERGRLGGIEILPLGGLSDDAASEFLVGAGISREDIPAIVRTARGHPLALRLAAEAGIANVAVGDAAPRVIDALAAAFRAGLDEGDRALLDAASIPRRVTRGVLDAMLDGDAEVALDRLAALSFVDATDEGLRLHDAVQAAVSARLRALDPRALSPAACRRVAIPAGAG